MSKDFDLNNASVVKSHETEYVENGIDNACNGGYTLSTCSTTLLPRPVASLVSLFAQSTSLSLRIGAFFGGAAIAGARGATLTGLELSRAVVEGVLVRASRDVAARSAKHTGKVEAESLLERSVSNQYPPTFT